jgi:putative hydrolase of the HAD superfamily
MKDKKLIAFNMYNTWVSAPTWPNPYKEIFSQLWISLSLYKELSTVVQTTDIDISDVLPKTWTSRSHLDQLLLKFQFDMDTQLSSLYIYEDFLPTVETLKQLWYTTAVVSNLSKPYIYPLTHLIPQTTFDYKILSYDVGMQKPDKQIFDHLIHLSWYRSDEIIMVGDSFSSDVQGAKNAGIDPIHIDRFSSWIRYHKNHISISTLKQLLSLL